MNSNNFKYTQVLEIQNEILKHKTSIEKLNQELKDLSGKFNDRILPIMKELGHDIKGIEQTKAQEKINLEKVEQEKNQRDLEEKMQNLGR